ncbi:MAG: twin-arginine translocase TatA/TatE family subunit [Candidatus Kapaibacterium sp.]|nr:twin-arginine translocase TatA/TatE family subunit [Ignavibacteriota bacterium]MCB9220730.1 twin-arginine translocase TatA/TatE family subunit [Ignavibacteria bacterium]
MFDIGLPELLLIGVVVLLLFGPEKLPEIARSLGKGMQKVKQAQMQFQNELNSVKEEMKVQEDDIVEDPINEMKKNVIKNVDDIKKNLRNLNKN